MENRKKACQKAKDRTDNCIKANIWVEMSGNKKKGKCLERKSRLSRILDQRLR